MAEMIVNSPDPRISGHSRVRRSLTTAGFILLGAAITAAVAVSLHLVSHPGYGTVASGGTPCTLTGTTTADGGTVTVCAQYAVSPNGHVHIRSVQASYTTANGYALPRFTITLRDGSTGALDERLSGPLRQGNAIQSYSSQFTAFAGTAARNSFRLGDTMVVTLSVTEYNANRPYNLALASVALVLGRPAFRCPDPGTGSSGGSSVPVC